MGQKVHPLGFRVGITKNHQSQWFARFHKHKYAQTVLEDRMLRETLTKLFPQLLNPVLKKKRDDELSVVPKITQIKIERGLIPYEIGIQIHAENCDLIKSSIENLKVNRDLLCQLQKTRRYLQHLRSKLNNLDAISESGKSASSNLVGTSVPFPSGIVTNGASAVSSYGTEARFLPVSAGKGNNSKLGLGQDKKSYGTEGNPVLAGREKMLSLNPKIKTLLKRTLSNGYPEAVGQSSAKDMRSSKDGFSLGSVGSRFSPFGAFGSKGKAPSSRYTRRNLTKQQLRRQRLILKRLRKRQSIRRRYNQFVANGNGVFLTKKGNKIVQKLTKNLNVSFLYNKENRNNQFVTNASLLKNKSMSSSSVQQKSVLSVFQSRIKKKFVSIFMNRMNRQFLQTLKTLLRTFAPISLPTGNSFLGSNPKWSLQRSSPLNRKGTSLVNFRAGSLVGGQHQSLSKLTKFVMILEQKSLKKMETLRKDYITLGSIPQTEAYNYYQMLTFLKQVKELVSQMKKSPFGLQKHTSSVSVSVKSLLAAKSQHSSTLLPTSSVKHNLTEVKSVVNLVSKKLNNIDNECRKIKLIEYLKQIVKKHRTNNIYLYLSTIADARKDLRKLKQFTKRNASFLFGLNLENSSGLPEEGSTLVNSTATQSSNFGFCPGGPKMGSLVLQKESGFSCSTSDSAMLTENNPSLLYGKHVSNVLQNMNLKQFALFPLSKESSDVFFPASQTAAVLVGREGKEAQNLSSSSEGPTGLTPNEKTLSEIFLEQIEKQRNMFRDNVQLTPKIAIKFYSVNSKTIKAKASVVADSIIDALEKRKAFRKVIKDSKEELMRTPGIKGVKIQVAGRLNGAEIARSEWVRAGRVPLQTLRANLDYSYKTANTIYGIIGIKVWIFKGYTKLI